MAYETVYKIPKDKMGGSISKGFHITKDNLGSLEEFKLLHFYVQNDFADTSKIRKGELPIRIISQVFGPFKEKTEPRKKSDTRYVERLIPVEDMPEPEDFKNVSLVEYKLNSNEGNLYHFLDVDPKKGTRMSKRKISELSGEKIREVFEYSNVVLDNLTEKFTLINMMGKSKFIFSTDNCVGEFSKYPVERFLGKHQILFPCVGLRIFGDEETAMQIIEESGIERYSHNHIPNNMLNSDFIKTGGISRPIKRGITYNLNLKTDSIDELIRQDNIIL